MSELRKEHAAAYANMMPMIKRHQDLAAKVCDVQRRLFAEELLGKFPGAELRELPRVVTFSVRQSLPEFDALLAQLDEKGIKVTEVIYDPSRCEFLIFGKP